MGLCLDHPVFISDVINYEQENMIQSTTEDINSSP